MRVTFAVALALSVAYAAAAQAAETNLGSDDGRLDFNTYAFTKESAACAGTVGATAYLGKIIQATSTAWSKASHASDKKPFTVDVLFTPQKNGKLEQIGIAAAEPASAGVEVLTSMKSIDSLPAMDKDAACLAGQKLGFRIESGGGAPKKP
jgi:hypothetical protein